MSSPLVSIIIPHYENEYYLPTAINSSLNQTYDNVEIIVVDSSELENPPFLSDKRVQYIQEEPKGVTAALNTGINESRGEFVTFLGADDFFDPTKLSKQVGFLRNNEKQIAYSDEYHIEGGKFIYKPSLPIKNQKQLHVNFFKQWGGIGARSVLIRRECFDKHMFKESLDIYEDFHLWVRLLRDFSAGRIPEALSYKRILNDSLSSKTDLAYRAGLEAISDLVNKYPELAEYKESCLADFHFQFAMRFLRDEKPEEAKSALWKSLRFGSTDPRVYIVLVIAALPIESGIKKEIFNKTHEAKKELYALL